MALSDNQHFSLRAELESTSPPKGTKPKLSYAQAVAAKTKVSLVHQDLKLPDQDAPDRLHTFQSRIYREAKSPGALLLDLSEIKDAYTDFQSLEIVIQQHPKIFGCQFLSEGKRRYLELYVRPKDDVNDIKQNEVVFTKKNLKVFPCTAVTGDYTITTVNLSHLPFDHPDEIGAGLKTSLAPFGEVIDVGIVTEPKLGVFMGSDYAVIGRDRKSTEYHELSHTDQIFHCTWSNMPTWCRYCHQTGHTKFECEKSKARIICYSCQQLGHRSFECPRKVATVQNKRRKGASGSASKPISNEAMKSQFAPTPSSKTSTVNPDTPVMPIRSEAQNSIVEIPVNNGAEANDEDDSSDSDFHMSDANSADNSDTGSEMEGLEEPQIDQQEYENLLQDQKVELETIRTSAPLTTSLNTNSQEIVNDEERRELESLHRTINDIYSNGPTQTAHPEAGENRQ
ncbi:hypothetical protein BD560DRAFT_412972, partial [Blakeslea trispora]